MVAPRAVVGDVHALLAFAGGADQRAIGIDAGLVEEGVGLPGPGALADVVDGVEQRVHIVGLETAAEVASGGRIGNAAGAQGIEEDFVVASQFDVFEAGAVAKGVVGEIEHVIRFVIGQMDLEQVQPAVDGLVEAEFAHEQVHGTDTAVANTAAALTDFVLNVAGRKHGLGAPAQVFLVQAFLNPLLATGQLLAYSSVHSNSFFVTRATSGWHYSSNPGNAEGFRAFSLTFTQPVTARTLG